MGCERVRDGGTLGFGGVRASMERRWLINAKTTVMRQKKWQEVQLQKELDEQRQKAEILERRKQERARLSAYIHSAAQPPVKCATNGKRYGNDNKRVHWKTCLLRDQELILKLRENAKAVVHNRPSKRGSSNPDLGVQGHYSCRMACCDSGLPAQFLGSPSRSGARDLCLDKNPCDLVQLLEVTPTCGETVTQNPLLGKDSHSAYEMLHPPKTRSATCEIAVNTSATWAQNATPSEADFVKDHHSPNMTDINNWSIFAANTIFDKLNESQSDRGVLSNLEDARPQVFQQVAGCCAESVGTNPEFASLEIALSRKRESTMRRSGPDLKEEILKSRLVNEAATTRLIAQVTAMESRLDDCDMNWKSICLQDDQVEAFPVAGPMQIPGSDVYPVHLNVVASNTNHQFSFNREIGQESSSRVSGIGIKGDEQDFLNSEVQKSAQHVSKTRFFLSSPSVEVLNDITSEGTVSHSSLANGHAEIIQRVQGNFEREDFQPFQQLHGNGAISPSHQESLSNDQEAISLEVFPEASGRQQFAQHVSKTQLFLSSPRAEVSNYISFDGSICGAPLVNGQAEMTHRIGRNFEREESKPFQQLYGNKAGSRFDNKSMSSDQGATSFEQNKITNIRLAEQMMYHSECSSTLHEFEGGREAPISSLLPGGMTKDSSREFLLHQGNVKPEKESLHPPLKTIGNACDNKAIEATSADSMQETHAAWKIDWNAPTNVFPEKNWEDFQSMRSKYYSSMPNSANINMGGEQSSHQSRLRHLVCEPRQQKLPSFLNCGYNRPKCPHTQGGEDHPLQKIEGSTLPSHLPTSETSGLVQISSDLESYQCHQDQHTCQDTNWTQNAGYLAPMLPGNNKNHKNVGGYVEYLGDKENHLESQRQSLLEEERKIFASLERLDWKLAAINLRPMNVGRESAISQGQYSTKSAPANLGSPRRTIVENFSMTAKKVVPYSALPPRSLTPQGAPMLRIPTARQRRLVGLTNKAGRMHNQNRKK